jgi:TonB family protein
MIRFAIAMLIGSSLIATGVFAQQTAPSSATPSSPQSQLPSGQGGEPSSTPVGTGTTRSALFKVCGTKNPPPCATPPRAIKSPDPKYSKEARKKKIEGITLLWLIVGADGLPRDIRVARSVGYGLDEEAIKAVKKWRFKPGTMDGKPVAVMVNVEVTFRLH